MVLINAQTVAAFDEELLAAIKRFWITSVPSKISVFGWRLLQDKLPTRIEYGEEGSLVTDKHEQCCVLCFNSIESVSHLFTSCTKTSPNLEVSFHLVGLEDGGVRG